MDAADAKRAQITAILSHKLDRVCRNMRDAVRLQELEDICGVRLAFVDNEFAPGAAGVLSFDVMAAVAQYYSDNLRSEVLTGMDERIRQGWPSDRTPWRTQTSSTEARPGRLRECARTICQSCAHVFTSSPGYL
jgi:DNA invertase Pin-like site-specific DNA recombinase